MSDVATNLARVKQEIADACAKAGRKPGDVQLLAVSKLQPSALIREAWAAGQRDFGENYAQELRDKAAELSALDGLRWHAIGPLQTNKAKYVAKVAYAFHALERLDVAQELSKRRTGEKLRCFIEVNVAGEASKSGVQPDQLKAFLAEVRALPMLEVRGLMTMPPLTDDPEAARPHFTLLRELAHANGLNELSMGTTHDYQVAIEEGATLIRVGTAIFGSRPAKAP